MLLGGEENETRRQMQAVIDFETRLAEITTPQEERRDEEKLYNRMSISDLQRLAPFVSFRFFTNLENRKTKTQKNLIERVKKQNEKEK